MRNLDLLKAKREEILRVAGKYGAHNVRIFGSTARNETEEESDIDLLVDLDPDRSLLDLGGLWAELNELFGVPVEVFTPNSLREEVRREALKDAVAL